MRGTIVLMGLLLALVEPAKANACGDKFLRVGRGARFQRGYVALHPASILLLARPRTEAGQALRDLQPSLKRAGHRPTVVHDSASLAAALEAKTYDIVMADADDALDVEPRTRGLLFAPSVLPVLHEAAPHAVQSAEQRFGCVVESPGKRSDVLAEIDGLMERRLKGAAVIPPR